MGSEVCESFLTLLLGSGLLYFSYRCQESSEFNQDTVVLEAVDFKKDDQEEGEDKPRP